MHFTDSGALLWVYDRNARTYKRLHPRVVCSEKDLYSIRPENAARDRRVETLFLSQVDGMGASAFSQIQVGKTPTREVAEAISFFTALQFVRLPSVGKAVSAMHEKSADELMRISFANVERATQVLERYARETGKSLSASPESMVEAVQGKHVKAVATEMPFLHNMLEQVVPLGKVIMELGWEILVASSQTGFITCDSPVVIVPRKGDRDAGFKVPGAAKYFPLTRQLCLRLGDPIPSFLYRNVDNEAVRIINQNIAANSERFIMGPTQVQLEDIVSSSGSVDVDPSPRFTVATVEADRDSSLQKMTFHARRCFYPKDGSLHGP
jgi:hypothetical protein